MVYAEIYHIFEKYFENIFYGRLDTSISVTQAYIDKISSAL